MEAPGCTGSLDHVIIRESLRYLNLADPGGLLAPGNGYQETGPSQELHFEVVGAADRLKGIYPGPSKINVVARQVPHDVQGQLFCSPVISLSKGHCYIHAP